MDQPKKTLVGERTLAYIALLLLSICPAEACESPIFVACLEHEMQAVKVRVKILLVFKVVTVCCRFLTCQVLISVSGFICAIVIK